MLLNTARQVGYGSSGLSDDELSGDLAARHIIELGRGGSSSAVRCVSHRSTVAQAPVEMRAIAFQLLLEELFRRHSRASGDLVATAPRRACELVSGVIDSIIGDSS